ncbi:hypothetical protein C8Q77DRAFT_1153434 [Trametes polyzona]|nr:hypothetical protein C8Q77DRAFT_1153434 [Trametes polyzona]
MSTSNLNDTSAIQALLDQLRSSEAWQKAVNANADVAQTPPTSNTSSTAPATQESRFEGGNTASSANAPPNAPQAPQHAAPLQRLEVEAGSSRQPEPGASAPPPTSDSQAQSVASLLSQLQASSSLAAVATATAGPSSSASRPSRPRPPVAAHAPSVLQQFGGSDFPSADGAALLPRTSTSTSTNAAPGPVPAPAARQDLRACTFQQALPHIARLSADEGFLKALAAMKTEQADLERRLWSERREIQRRHEEKVKAARIQANIIGAGAGLTPYEADVRLDLSFPPSFLAPRADQPSDNPTTAALPHCCHSLDQPRPSAPQALTESFRKELQRFDRDRVLPAWDGLLAKQQAALESLGVPAMFPTTQAADRERQQEIMQVLGRVVQDERSQPFPEPGGDGS